MPRTIPQELSDLIVDFLHNDIAALCNAGLVCKSWLPASRVHLFSDITLCARVNVHHALEVICAEGSTIPPYISKLKLQDDESQSVDETLLRLPLLSNLKCLHFISIDMDDFTPDAKKRLTTMSARLTTLSLYDFRFETVKQAVDLIASASCLQNIEFRCVGCDGGTRNHSSQAVVPPLKRMKFDPDPLLDSIMNWISRCRPTPSIQTLVVTELPEADSVPALCNFIRYLGSAVEHLTISCHHAGIAQALSAVALRTQLDLSHNVSLRNLFFSRLSFDTNWPTPLSCPWIISIISRIAHRSLESVTVGFLVFVGQQINAEELSALDTVFMNSPLSDNSTKLCFRVCGVVEVNAAALAQLRKGLAGLDSKGRLEISPQRFLYR